jgi:hypothetical protein
MHLRHLRHAAEFRHLIPSGLVQGAFVTDKASSATPTMAGQVTLVDDPCG